jgi:peptidoglycan/LPS O-acetylase OafA/YrhL
MPQPSKMRFHVLDGWRGVCALLVALYHLDIASHIHDLALVRHAWILVDFFFVLSGFVIAFAYQESLGDWRGIRQFAIRRFGRLWPLHAAMLLPFIAIAAVKLAGNHAGAAPFTGTESPVALLASLALVHVLHLFAEPVWNVPSWSISAEFCTYGVFVLYCLVAPRLRAFAAIVIAAAGLAVLITLSPRLLDATSDFGFFRCVYGFFAGVLTCLLWRARPKLRVGGTAAEMAILAITGLFVCLVPRNAAAGLAAPLLFAVMVHVFAVQSGRISRAMDTGPVALMGTLSYSLYTVHYLVSRLLVSALQHAGFVPGPSITDGYPPLMVPLWLGDTLTLGYVAAITAIAFCTWRFIEEPGRKFFNARAARIARSRPAAREAADASF